MISKVYRGGSWKRNPGSLRSKIRCGIPSFIRFNTQGFRIAEDVGNDRYRIIRGGSWNNNPRSLRSAIRLRFEVSCPSSTIRSVNEPGSRCIYLGFRVVEDLR